MMHKNVVQWIVDHLIDVEGSPWITNYHLYSVTGLLLVLLTYSPNIREGSSECLTVLERYLQRDACRSNVQKCLLTIMQNPKIRAQARGMALDDAITKRQLVRILSTGLFTL